jgi:putative transcriptional regulator
MPVTITLDAALARRGMTGKQLAERIGLSETQLSLFRSGKVRGIRFATLARICAALECKPGELLDYRYEAADLAAAPEAEV